MKHNVGSYDSAIRFIFGGVYALLMVHFRLYDWAWLALVPITTSILEFCPLYCLFHIDTTFTDR